MGKGSEGSKGSEVRTLCRYWLVSYLPIGGGAIGRGGSTSGNIFMFGLRFRGSGFLATGYWPLTTLLGKPENLENLF